jgi:hypothetical protein
LSRQISDAEEFESKMLNPLPLITADWAVDAKVKLGVPGTCYLSADQNIHNIVSAEISTATSKLKSSEDDTSDSLSTEMKRQRIYALGMVFYELFSGGQKACLDENQRA